MHNIPDVIKKYYESKMGKGLPDYSILGWESEEAQMLRFHMLVSNVPLEGKKLLDVGCGVGNLAEFLLMNNIQADYTGVDILQSMVCRALEKGLNARFLHCDIFKENPFSGEKFDVVYSSGIFNLNLNNNIEFLRKALHVFSNLSRDIIAFNLLSDKSNDKEDKYFYYNEKEIDQLITKELSEQISDLRILNGYLRNDFTVICTKRRSD